VLAASSGRDTLPQQEEVSVPDTVAISIDLLCTLKKEAEGLWVAGCPLLDLYSQGSSENDAKRSLEEAILLWVENCVERGTLDQALRECGFHSVRPETVREGDQHIAVHPASQQETLPANTFPIHLSIPAYQAAAFSKQLPA
jgi:predicted RNase H-like HicB family nuclease